MSRIRNGGLLDIALDNTDRKVLSLLSEDSSRSYAELGKAANLSPPAIHERVKRLRNNGTIKRTAAILDGHKIGRSVLAFVEVDAHNWTSNRRIAELGTLPEVEEIHTISGDSAILLKVRVKDTRALEILLEVIHNVDGVVRTRSQIVLTTYLERGPSPLADHDGAS